VATPSPVGVNKLHLLPPPVLLPFHGPFSQFCQRFFPSWPRPRGSWFPRFAPFFLPFYPLIGIEVLVMKKTSLVPSNSLKSLVGQSLAETPPLSPFSLHRFSFLLYRGWGYSKPETLTILPLPAFFVFGIGLLSLFFSCLSSEATSFQANKVVSSSLP